MTADLFFNFFSDSDIIEQFQLDQRTQKSIKKNSKQQAQHYALKEHIKNCM